MTSISADVMSKELQLLYHASRMRIGAWHSIVVLIELVALYAVHSVHLL